jgi:hypothetical protein
VTYMTHDQVGFKIPDTWLQRAGIPAVPLVIDHFRSRAPHTVIDITSITSPIRLEGVRWFDEARLISIFEGIIASDSIPPIDVDLAPAPAQRYRVRDGLHRYYASIALGFSRVPVTVLPFFDINGT